MKALLYFSSLLAATAIMISCSNNPSRLSEKDALASHIDSAVKPGDDFFMYANGKWFKQHPIPASEQSNGLWQMIDDTINSQVLAICKSAAALTNASKGSDKQKIGDFYFSGMDSVTLNKKGIEDIKPFIKQIDQVKDINGFVKTAADFIDRAREPRRNKLVAVKKQRTSAMRTDFY